MGLRKCRVLSLCFSLLLSTAFMSSVNAVTNESSVNTGSLSGTGTVEGYIEQDIMHVVLPATNLDYLLDPKGFIYFTQGAKYKDAVFNYSGKENGFVFFSEVKDGKMYYSSSKKLDFQNKSTFPVNVDVVASFDVGDSNMVLKDSESDFNGETAGIVFTLSNGGNAKSLSDGISRGEFGGTLTGISSKYAYTYDTSNGYRYALKAGTNDVFPSYTVDLKSSCDSKAKWENVNPSLSKLSVTWYIEKNSSADLINKNSPYIKEMDITIDSFNLSDVVLSIEPNGNQDISVASLEYVSGTKKSSVSANYYEFDNNRLTIKSSSFKSMKTGSYSYILKFSDGSVDTVKIDIK